MRHAQDRDFIETSDLNVEEILRMYTVLLEFYSELETVSAVIFKELERGSPVRIIQANLEVKMLVAEKILRQSHIIAEMKKAIFEEAACGEGDRRRVRKCDELLTITVNRIIEQENRGRDLVMRQGMKIERR